MPNPDIGSDATIAGVDPQPRPADSVSEADVDTIGPASSRTSGSRPRSWTPPPRDLPPDLDRASLTPAERVLTISRYILLSRLGAGGMGLVYLALDPALDRKVAVKLLRPGADGEPAAEAHARLHREAQALARLSHPNVVAVYDVGTYDARALYGDNHGDNHGDDGVFLVMEYIEGVTLARWLDERRRPWRDVLAVFLAAGRGLAAAHAVGILHRDFKPSNVLVKPDASVHVFDFGLARAAGTVDPSDHHFEPGGPHTSASISVSLAAPLTQIGAVVGTPVYMAPEQRGGVDVDERSDQFSFCVALYEGLYGCRPFSGENFYALEVAKLAGNLDAPKRPVTIPNALRRAVVRGLAGEPELRWSSLAALLAELERIHRRRPRRLLAAAALGLGLVAGLATWAGTRAPACADTSAALGDAWNPRDAPMLERSFVATGLPYARDTWQRTRERLDRHALAWLAARRDACEATLVRGAASHEHMDRRMQCLDRLRDELADLVAVFAEPDADVVAHAVAAVSGLTAISTCDDPDAVVQSTDPVAADAARAITRAAAQERAGRLAAAAALAEASLATADRLGDRALRAAAEQILGEVHIDRSDFAAAEQTLGRAYFDAIATTRDHVAAQAAISLIALTGDRMARHADGRAWARHADALLDRLGRPPGLESTYLQNLANLHARAGAYAEAEPLYRMALDRIPADDAIARATDLTNLASTIAFLGRTAESIDLYMEALTLREAVFGADHPQVAHTLTNLGGSYALAGDTARNEAVQRRALAIWRASLEPRHELLAYPIAALGDIALERADYPAALAHFEEARTIWEANGGPDFPTVASMTERMATTRLLQGDVPAARALADRAVDMWTRSASPEPIQLAMAHLVRAQVAQAERDYAAARDFGERARGPLARDFGDDHLYTLAARLQLLAVDLERAEQTPPPADCCDPDALIADITTIVAAIERDHGSTSRWIVEPLTLLGRALVLAGRPADARTALTRAAAIADVADLVALRAEIDLGLARAAWALGEHPRARIHATAAAELLRRIGSRRMLADVEAWLLAHAAP